MNSSTTKEPVKLRFKLLKDGATKSLYLDIYSNGRRAYEFLKLYLIKERTKEDRERNRETLRLASAIKAQRVLDIQNGKYGFTSGRASKLRLFDYFEALIGTKGSNQQGWAATLAHLRDFEKNDKITLADIDRKWVTRFRDYLSRGDANCRIKDGERPLGSNTQIVYFSILKTALSKAERDGLIQKNPMIGVERPKPMESQRQYLTIEEVRLLARTGCGSEDVKRAFLFSCLTGLRKSDVERITWSEVQSQDTFTRVVFRQKKTGGQEYIDIAPEAAELMGPKGREDDRVFGGLPSEASICKILSKWCSDAGINKHITFHCARHTFAVMMLDLGTDIYTVSKLLGHRELSTTQIYAKVLDKAKQEAVGRIPKIFGGGEEEPL